MSSPRAPFLAAIFLASCLVALAEEPTTAVAPQATWQPRMPATQPVAEAKLQVWFNDLAASDAAVRDAALAELLALTRADLAGLRRVVERSRPVAPSQAGVLREVVTHVYLSAETYDCEPRIGFLGLLIPTLDRVEVQRDERPEEALIAIGGASTGVPIEYRISGFCAFRALREGDVVLGILSPTSLRLRDWGELSRSVRTFRAGETLTLEVLRQGTVLNVPVKLDARPLVPDENVWHNEILPTREAAAEEYWNKHFAPLVEERVSSSSDPFSRYAGRRLG